MANGKINEIVPLEQPGPDGVSVKQQLLSQFDAIV